MFQVNSEVYGGTEHMARLFKTHVESLVPTLNKFNCMIAPGYMPSVESLLKDDKDTILWLHNPFNQFNYNLLYEFSHPLFLKKLKAVVVVSNHLKNSVVKDLGIDRNKVVVISNVIEPVENDVLRFKNVNKVKAIYTSSADRGLEVLLNAMPLIEGNIEVNVFSNFYPDISAPGIEFDSRVVFYGLTPHTTVRKVLSESHIFSYPCSFDETFCISLGEAISANCIPVHSDQDALVEVGQQQGMVYKIENNNHVEVFAKTMNDAIKRVQSNLYDPKDAAQHINSRFSLDVFKKSWIEFSKSL
jgi:glycosyltransferase involved in cell wall biosynthesis